MLWSASMLTTRIRFRLLTALLVGAASATGCSSNDVVTRPSGTGGDGSGTGGSAATGGAGSASTGGSANTGGMSNGTGGAPTGQGGSPADGSAPTDGAAGARDAAPEAGATSGRYVCPAGAFGDPMPGTPMRIAAVPPSDAFNMQNGTFGILEGPVWIGDSLYLSEIGTGTSPPASRILKVTTTGAVSVAVTDSGSNGLAVDAAGNLVGAVHKDGSISQFDLTTDHATPLATGINGTRFDAPNDLVVRSDGNIYFSDTTFQAPPTPPQPQQQLYRVAAGTHAVSIVDPTHTQPNGVTLSLDENTLFVAWPNGIYKYALMQDGSVGAPVLLTSSVGSGDGMTVDCAGNLYVATNTDLVVLSPAGTEIHRITFTGVQSITNAAFGGVDHKTLYVTALGSGAQKGLFTVGMAIPGLSY
jgi:gluconolactonase